MKDIIYGIENLYGIGKQFKILFIKYLKIVYKLYNYG